MNHTVQQRLTSGSKAHQNSCVKQVMLAALMVLALMCSTTNAEAASGPATGMKAAVAGMPNLSSAGLIKEDEPEKHQSIIGLWHARYTSSDGSPFIETLKEWHSDFTEFENVNHNPAIGSVCAGAWKHLDEGMVRLHHLGFLFTLEGVPSGSFTVDETDTVAETGMSYEGVFVFRIYDVNGVFTGTEITGTIAAGRITVR